jgi:integrase
MLGASIRGNLGARMAPHCLRSPLVRTSRYIRGAIYKQAKILLQLHAGALPKYASTRRHPKIARVIVRQSLKAGMRAGEIANLSWDMISTPSGDINSTIELRDYPKQTFIGPKAVG